MTPTSSLAADLAVVTDDGAGSEVRLRRIVTDHYAYVWRCLRHMGVGAGDADDAAQQVFLVVSRKLADVACDSERAFLFATAMRIAARHRRTVERRHEAVDSEALLERMADEGSDAAARLPARVLLEHVLDTMPDDLRAVFVLYEIEELTMGEIAEALELPSGTVASRVRRAREQFRQTVRRLSARAPHRGTEP